jgi:hypothetical protein
MRVNDEVGYSRPLQVLSAFWPLRKIDILKSSKIDSLGLFNHPLQLKRLLSGPTNDQRARWPLNKVLMLARALHRVEDDLHTRRRGDSYEGRLGTAVACNTRHHSISLAPDEVTESRSPHI